MERPLGLSLWPVYDVIRGLGQQGAAVLGEPALWVWWGLSGPSVGSSRLAPPCAVCRGSMTSLESSHSGFSQLSAATTSSSQSQSSSMISR